MAARIEAIVPGGPEGRRHFRNWNSDSDLVLSGTGQQVPLQHSGLAQLSPQAAFVRLGGEAGGRAAGDQAKGAGMTIAKEYLDRRWTALILLCVAQFVVVLDASIVNVALPSIGKGLHFSEANLPWVVNAYVIAFGGFLLLGGRAADLLGRRRVFMVGLAVVAVASLAAGFAANQGQLIAARAAQGLGAAIISPAALSIVTTLFADGAERNKALGAWGAVAGSAGAAGVLLGGILTDGLGWQWVLWVN